MNLNVESFLKNKEENIFGISIKKEDKQHISFIIDDFEFKLSLENIQLSTEEDILIPICEKINKMELKTYIDVILEFSKLYGEEMGEEKPLYEGQDVFEDENDNNDIKFEGRMRLTEESFPSELFVHVLKFLKPSFVCKLSRVSKKWLKLTQLDVLWKDFCKKEGCTELSEGNQRFIEEYKTILCSFPKELPLPEIKFESDQIRFFQSKYYHSNHLYIQILDLKAQQFISNPLLSFFLTKFNETSKTINRESNNYFINWDGQKCVKMINGVFERLDIGPIFVREGDIFGYDYDKNTGELHFIYNDTDFGIAHKEMGLDLSVILIAKYGHKLVRRKIPLKKN